MKRVLVVGASLLSLNAFALDGAVDITGCPTTSITVGNIKSSSGWGGHFSTGANENGYGGYYAECHLTGSDEGAGKGSVTILCHDGYTSPADHVDVYRADLGPRDLVDQVNFKVTSTGVAFEVLKHSVSGYTPDENSYVMSGYFPLGRSAGFCRENTLYYEIDGVLSQTPSRNGSGYTMDVETIN